MTEPSERDRFERAMTIFEHALTFPGHQRRRHVRAACGDDRDLLEQVESLLEQVDADDGFLERDPLAGAHRDAIAGLLDDLGGAHRAPSAGVPEIAGYTILRTIGRGGVGQVYEAEQASSRRRVALKVFASSTLSTGLRARFAQEAEILTRLRHPGIAELYASGTAAAGRGEPVPYFTMELVDGQPLTRYAWQRQLGRAASLDLMARVCDIVEYAHTRGIIHRDLKPDNILVEATGAPRVLDFGVARVTDRASLASLGTGSGQLIGTLVYMSPAQVDGSSVRADVRSDVYALGVLTYQLLARRLPLDVAGLTFPEAIVRLRSVEPPALGSLDEAFAGPLEATVHRALERAPERRHATAAELASALRGLPR